jgi:hypothetical protein
MSFTNLSLVPVEMLASGVVPVLSGLSAQYGDLDNSYVRWTEPTPQGIADALCDIVAGGGADPDELSASVHSYGWDAAGMVALKAIEEEVYGPAVVR